MMNMSIANAAGAGQEAKLARQVKAAISGTIALALLVMGLWGAGEPVIGAAQADQAPTPDVTYFPSRFPSPEGAPEPHIPAF